MKNSTTFEGTTITIVRTFNAPREKVWKAWTEPEQMKKWWGPKDFTCPVAKMDLREGGKFLFAMHGPAGTEFDKDMWSTGTYKEIVPMEKLVCTDSFSDEEGNIVSASEYGMEGFPLEMLVTIIFEDTDDGKTKMTLTHEGHPAGQMSEMAGAGWNESLDKLEASL